MANMIEMTGKTIEEAIHAAAVKLGVSEGDLSVEVLETPSKRLFGLLGETPAKIRATVKISEPVPKIEVPPVEIEEPPIVEEETAAEFEPILEPSPAVEENPAESSPVESAEKFLQDVFAVMNLQVTITATEESDGGYLLDLSGKNLGVLIGRRGQVLDALQYLLNLSVNRMAEEKIHFTLDVEDYRRRREDALTKLAKGVAERAIKTRRDVRLEPMNRHERKIIHTVLQDNSRVETHSAGEEPYRYIIVTPVRRGKK